MNEIKTSAGITEITTFSNEWHGPSGITVRLKQNDWQDTRVQLGVNDLYDLRYCIDRMLAKLGNPQ